MYPRLLILQAELLYENGQLVEQLATCEPLLVGKTEVLALQVDLLPVTVSPTAVTRASMSRYPAC